MDEKLYDSVSRLIIDIIEKESSQWNKKKGVKLDKNSLFMESLEIDSFLALEIVSHIEKKFKIEVKDEELAQFDTIENIVNLIEKKKKVKSRCPQE